MAVTDEDKRAFYIARVHEMAKSGQYADFSDIEVALILKEVSESHDYMNDPKLRDVLDQLCKKAAKKDPGP